MAIYNVKLEAIFLAAAKLPFWVQF